MHLKGTGDENMDWWKDLYDGLRLKTTFGNISKAQTEKEVSFMEKALNLRKGDKILDLFAGLGRHSIELAKRGYLPTAIEYQRNYLKIAKQNAKEAKVKPKFKEGDVRKVDFRKGYDAVIIMYNSFGYFNDKDEFRLVKKIASALKTGGRFLLEILNRDWILANFVPRSEQVIKGITLTEERSFNSSQNRITSKLTYMKGRNELARKVMSWRVYSFPEIRALLRKAGLKVVATYSNFSKKPITIKTRVMQIISVKK